MRFIIGILVAATVNGLCYYFDQDKISVILIDTILLASATLLDIRKAEQNEKTSAVLPQS